MKRTMLFCGTGLMLGVLALQVPLLAMASAAAQQAEASAKNADRQAAEKPAPEAVERARKQVRMLDDIYKTTVVLITDKYVHEEDDFPAGSAAIALFQTITDKGWHDVRLIDASGDPYNPENVAKDAFEKQGVKQLKGGKDYVEKVVQKDGQYHLRALTPVPVVMEKCVMCHPNYADAEEGEPIGAITYSVPIE